MTPDWYVDETRTGGLDNGTSWANAFLTMAQADTAASAGDIVWVDNGHNENMTATFTFTGGTTAAPIFWYSVDSTDDSYTPGATLTTTTSKSIRFDEALYFFGLDLLPDNDISMLEDAHVVFTDGTIGSDEWFTSNADCYMECHNVAFRFSGTGGKMKFQGGLSLAWFDCRIDSAGSSPNFLFETSSRGGQLFFQGLDVTHMNSTGYVFQAPVVLGDGHCLIRGSGLHMGASQSVFNADPDDENKTWVEIYNVDSGNTQYGHYIANGMGVCVEDSTTYVTAVKKTDGQATSWQIDTNTRALDGLAPFRIPLPPFYADANPTLSVEFLAAAGVTYQDDEVWVEVTYPDATTGSIERRDVSSRMTDITGGTPANLLTTGTASWTEVLTGTPQAQRIEVVIGDGVKPDGQAGTHQVWVCVAKPSETLRVSPEVLVS